MLAGKKLKLIVAVSENNVIGTSDGKIPWQGLVPSDMARFVELTTEPGSNSVVMGRVTWETIPERFRPLPNRENIVITRNLSFDPGNSSVIIANSLKNAVKMASSRTVWIMGGAQIYGEALPYVDEMHITKIHGTFIGGVRFPPCGSRWVVVQKKIFGRPPDRIFSSYLIYRRKYLIYGRK